MSLPVFIFDQIFFDQNVFYESETSWKPQPHTPMFDPERTSAPLEKANFWNEKILEESDIALAAANRR